ncbi:MAG: TIGR01777 family oxidoreductase [Bacteroidaceae bacterium]
MTKILISGGTGLVGSHLSRRLVARGYEVTLLSRKSNKEGTLPIYAWDYTKSIIDEESIESIDFIIHLAGARISSKRWTKDQMREIVNSRVKSAEFLLDIVKKRQKKLQGFISASAIGYYGCITSDTVFVEEDAPYNDFLGNTCRKWEEVANKFQQIGIRTVKLRTGVVLASQGGALAQLLQSFKFRVGVFLGTGKQYMSWIHIDDLCDIYIKAIEDVRMQGSYNAVAPEQITNMELVKKLALYTTKPFFFFGMPALLLRIFLGKIADMLLNGSRISSRKLLQLGFDFKFPTIHEALIDLFSHKKR